MGLLPFHANLQKANFTCLTNEHLIIQLPKNVNKIVSLSNWLKI